MKNEEENKIKVGEATYEFGGPCPPIESVFFPNEPEVESKLKEQGEKDDSTQSS